MDLSDGPPESEVQVKTRPEAPYPRLKDNQPAAQ